MHLINNFNTFEMRKELSARIKFTATKDQNFWIQWKLSVIHKLF